MKRVAMGLAFALAVSAFADQHAQTINKTGFVGVNKTQSAQSLGHSKLVFNALGDFAFGNNMFRPKDEAKAYPYALENEYANQKSEVANYIGISAYVGFAIGLFDIIDLGVTLPVYYDQFNGNALCGAPECNGDPLSGTKKGYVGLRFRPIFRSMWLCSSDILSIPPRKISKVSGFVNRNTLVLLRSII